MRKVIASLTVFVLFILTVLIMSHQSEEGFNITIRNNLDQAIPHLELTYPNGTKELDMKPHASRTIHIYPNNFGEGSITLIYNNSGIIQEIMVFGYIENGYDGRAEVNIDSVLENGKLQVTVQEKTELY